MTIDVTVTDMPSADDLAAIGDRLVAFNATDVGPAGRRPLAVLIHAGDGAVIGGLTGYTAWGWLYIQSLFVPEALRGQGTAGRLLSAAEAEARARGCHGALIDTFNPRALKAYLRQGFETFGEVPDFPHGRTRSFLQKRFEPLN